MSQGAPGFPDMCTIAEDGGPQSIEDEIAGLFKTWSAREIGMATCDFIINIGWIHTGWGDALNDLAVSLEADHRGARERRKHWRVIRMEVDELVKAWHSALVDMSTGHSHDAFTRGEHSTDDLMKPILTAPVAQLREFASKLATELESDDRVPFLVWSTFKRVVTPLILSRPEGEVLTLKTDLAKEVAELVEAKIPRTDLVTAIAAALQWRGLEQLTKVKESVEAGAQPRMRGRQSCLFLDATDAEGKTLATVIL